MSTSSIPTESAKQPAFDPVAAGAEIDKVYGFWQQIEKQAAEKAENAAKLKADLIRLLQHAKVNAPNFKEFVEKHTRVSRAEAYRLLAIADGRGEEISEQNRRNVANHRARNVSLTSNVRDTGAPAGNDADPEKSAADRKAVNAELDKPKSKPMTSTSAPKPVSTGPKRGSPEWGLAEAERFDKEVLAVVGRDVAEGILKFLREKHVGRTNSHLKIVA
jgi:hypothetical protein